MASSNQGSMKQRTAKKPSQLSDEEIHDVLRNKRRRLVIDILQSENEPVSVRELSEEIGSVESDSNPPPRNIKQSVYVSLLQTHLPKLDELGIIDYESNGKMVSVDGGLQDVTFFMETIPKYGISRIEYYAALGVLGVLTTFAAQIGAPVISAFTPLTWAYGFFLLIFVSGLYHLYQQGNSILHRILTDRKSGVERI